MIPAETKILNEIEARLGNILKNNGYSLNIKKIERGKLEPFKSQDIPAINYWPTGHSRADTEYGYDRHVLRLIIDVRDTTRDDDFPNVAAKMIADVVTAIFRKTTAPLVTDPYDGDLNETVRDVSMLDSGYQIGEGQKPWVGALVEVEVVYDSPSGDMFTYQP